MVGPLAGRVEAVRAETAEVTTLAGRTGCRPDTVMVHSAPDADRVVFGSELRAMATRASWFTLYEHHTRTEGRLDPARPDALCPDWRKRETWACGPEAAGSVICGPATCTASRAT